MRGKLEEALVAGYIANAELSRKIDEDFAWSDAETALIPGEASDAPNGAQTNQNQKRPLGTSDLWITLRISNVRPRPPRTK